MNFKWGIRARVMLVAILPMLVLALVLTAFYTSLRLSDLDEAHTARGLAFARQLAVASEYAVFSGNRDALQQLANAILVEDDVVGVTITDSAGEVLAGGGRLDEALALPRHSGPLRLGAFGSTLRIVEPIVPSSLDLSDEFAAHPQAIGTHAPPRPLGSVVLDLSRSRLKIRRNELLLSGLGSVLLVLIGSLALASYMSRGVTRPIRQVASTVQRIGRGEFDERLPPIGGGSLGVLADGVNEMAARLASAHQEMQRQVEEATAELRTRKEEAERANLYKSRFLAAASHDLHQPMHALGLFIAELARQPLGEAPRAMVDRIAASAAAMEDLLDSLLDISRLDAGALQPKVRSFALQPLIEHIAEDSRSTAEARNLRLRVRPCAAWVRSDPILLQRILTNLVSNAVRYTHDGSVLVACRRRGQRIRLEVRDSGVGIAPEAQEIVFHEFVQLDNPARMRDKGLGLGLAIVRRLTDLLGHRLELRSAPGRGSVFAVEMDLSCPEPPAAAHDAEREPGDLAGLRVLVIDPDPLARSAMESLLNAWDCAVTAIDGCACPEGPPSGPEPQVVICDSHLNGSCGGIEAIRTLRAFFGADLPAVLISGDTGGEIQQLAQREGLPLMHKPVRPARLRALLNRLFAHP